MKDYKLKLRYLRVSHTVGWSKLKLFKFPDIVSVEVVYYKSKARASVVVYKLSVV